jgi:hypothetical protein
MQQGPVWLVNKDLTEVHNIRKWLKVWISDLRKLVPVALQPESSLLLYFIEKTLGATLVFLSQKEK